MYRHIAQPYLGVYLVIQLYVWIDTIILWFASPYIYMCIYIRAATNDYFDNRLVGR